MGDNTKKFVTLENLQYFLEKLKYELAHNGPDTNTQEKQNKDSSN